MADPDTLKVSIGGYEMKSRIFLVFLMIQLAAAVAFAGIHVAKSTMATPDNTHAQDNPQTALNTRTGQTFVVWQRSENSFAPNATIIGRIVNAQGSAISAELNLGVAGISEYGGGLSVAYNPLLNEYMVAYDAEGTILLRRVAATGKPAGKAINITTDSLSASSNNFRPRIIFNPTTHGYTVIWTREPGNSTLVGASVTSAGKVNGPVFVIRTSCCGTWTLDLDYLPLRNKVLAVFYEHTDTPNALLVDYYLATLDPNLSSVAITKINTKPDVRDNEKLGSTEASLAVLPDSSALVFYSDQAGVKGRKISSDGKVIGAPFVAFRAPQNKTILSEPSAVFSTTSKGSQGILVATEDNVPTGSANTWAQVLSPTGLPVGAPILVNSTTSTTTARDGQISVLPVAPGVSGFQFQFYQTVSPLGHTSVNLVAPLSTEIVKFKLSLQP